jgi:DNA-binding SARP family transcriptional activator/tetratricopeptide (TPR) repeat protein
MEFEVLGPLRVRQDAGAASPSGRMQSVLLSMLLVRANQPVPVDVLAEAMWGAQADARAPKKLQLHVHRLRQTLGESGRLSFDAGGYRLEVLPGELDAERFLTLVDEGAEASVEDPERGAKILRDALALWRGEPYGGIDVPEISDEVSGLSDRRLVAREELYAAELACGRHASVVGELAELTRQHPLRERPHALLMTALYRGGRQADALQAYQRARRTLVDELGLEPGPELRLVERHILAGEPVELAAPTPAPPVPAQLPHNVPGFVGRQAELAELSRLVSLDAQDTAIAVVSGTAGVGKTALAVHWAHQVKDDFPDGQLYVDLHGYGPEEPVAAADALAAMLRALGVEGAAIPVDLSERSARFRSRLDGRRMLLLLDNAATVEQVRPLLPGTSSCCAVVTSRDSLAGLAAREGAARIVVDRMSADEAGELLRELLGGGRDATPELLSRLGERCVRLPLALRIAAERIRERRGANVADLVTELTDEQTRLDLLDAGGDTWTSVRAVFSWSYRQLAPEAARVFRLCGLHPGHDIDAYALAALSGQDDARPVRRSLDTLVRAHLVDETTNGRFQLHGLLRAYAAELTEDVESEQERDEALARLAGYFLHTATAAMQNIAPDEVETTPEPHPRPGAIPTLTSYESALRWLDSERSNLVTLADRATERGLPTYTAGIGGVIWRYLDLGSYLDDSRRLHTRALAVARERGDRVSEGVALRAVGIVYHRMDRYDDAARHLDGALVLQEELGNRRLQAAILNDLANVYHVTGRVSDGTELLQRSLELYRELGHRSSQSKPLSNLGFAYQRLGRSESALECLRQALAIAEEFDNRPGQAHALVNMVRVCRDAGRYDEALEYAHRVLALARESGINNVKGYVMDHLGTVYCRLGDHEMALHHHRDALAAARTTGDNDLKARALNGLAEVHASAGRTEEAVRQHQEALAAAESVGVRYEEARAHTGLGDAFAALGDPREAAGHWRSAVDIYRALDAVEADRVAGRITGPPPGGPASRRR